MGPQSAYASFKVLLTAAFASGMPACAFAGDNCTPLDHAGARYTICTFDARNDAISLFLAGKDGQKLADFDRLSATVTSRNEKLVFAMNAGMYHEDRNPVGLYIEDGRELNALVTRDGPGNFHLRPNGVFHVSKGMAGVTESTAYAAGGLKPLFATQSGPMLVIDGVLHPRFQADGTSRHIRNGVGVNGDRVVFALAETPVTLHAFACLFRDRLATPNALYLDGSVSRLYSTGLGRSDSGAPLGPMVAVTVPMERRP